MALLVGCTFPFQSLMETFPALFLEIPVKPFQVMPVMGCEQLSTDALNPLFEEKRAYDFHHEFVKKFFNQHLSMMALIGHSEKTGKLSRHAGRLGYRFSRLPHF